MEKKKEVIILNVMYKGGYLNEGDNIGHEIINLIQDDDGKFYIWLNSMGTFNNKYNKDMYLKTVLMIRYVSKGLYKILGKAENCRTVDGASLTGKKNAEKRFEQQKNLGKYNGVKLADIFSNNSYNGIIDSKNTLITFEADKVYEPIHALYLTKEKENENEIIRYVPFGGRETLRMYFSEEDQDNEGKIDNKQKCYINLHEIVADDSLWKAKEKETYEDINIPEHNIFDILGKERDELAFSNALYYFLREHNLIGLFLNTLDKSIPLNEHFEAYREKNNIDLLFIGKEHIVILENKIDSGINGTERGNDTDLCKEIEEICKKHLRYQTIEMSEESAKKAEEDRINKIKELLEKILGKAIDSKVKGCSQLSKYYIYALNYALDKNLGHKIDNIKCFILCPEYAKFRFKTDKNGYIQSEYILSSKYNLITYKKIYDFFSNHISDKNYGKDFLSALNNLSSEYDDRLEKEMKARFVRVINRVNTSNGTERNTK